MSNIKRTLYENGAFFKGNVHCHSTLSDGSYTPEQLKDEYKKHAYNFILFSDHNTNTNFTELNDDNFIALQGFEGNMDVDRAFSDKDFHFIFFKQPNRNCKEFNLYKHLEYVQEGKYTDIASVQTYVDKQAERGYMAMFNHHYWSFNDCDDSLNLNNILAAEIYNTGCDIDCDNGDSMLMYDLMLRSGKKVYAMATDDNHNYRPIDDPFTDSFNGYIVVKATGLDEESILEAIYDGSFYSSQGPKINDFYIDIEKNEIVLTCSNATKVYFTNQSRGYRTFFSKDGELTECRAELTEWDNFIRAVVYDKNGKRAWTNPIWL